MLFFMYRRTPSSHAAWPIVIVGKKAHRHIDVHPSDDLLVLHVEVLESVTAYAVSAVVKMFISSSPAVSPITNG